MLHTLDQDKQKKLTLLEYYLKLHKKYPRKKYFVPLAETYRSLDYLDEASEVLKEGLKWHTGYYVARAMLADVYYQMGHFIQASLEADRVIDLDPQNLTALRTTVRVSVKTGETKKTSTSLAQLLKLYPGDKVALQVKSQFGEEPIQKQKETDILQTGRVEDFQVLTIQPLNEKKSKIDRLHSLLFQIQTRTRHSP